MFVSPISFSSPQQVPTSSAGLVRWEDFDLRVAKLSASIINRTVENQVLNGTQLSCTIDTEAGQWKNRKIYIESILADTIERCPKDEPLVLFSQGSAHLLIEYILGKTLIENDFSQISFILVDPTYPPEDLQETNQVLKDFFESIESVFFNINKAPFDKGRIRFLSRSQNIAKYFPSGANVIVIESLPPYAELIKDMQKSQVPMKSPQDLVVGGRIVPSRPSKYGCVYTKPIYGTDEGIRSKTNRFFATRYI